MKFFRAVFKPLPPAINALPPDSIVRQLYEDLHRRDLQRDAMSALTAGILAWALCASATTWYCHRENLALADQLRQGRLETQRALSWFQHPTNDPPPKHPAEAPPKPEAEARPKQPANT